MKLAIVILNYNSGEDCRKCIADLKQQTGVDIEIIVVDNCSRDEERKYVENLCREQNCTFISNSENRGYNAGNNIGLRYAAEKGYEYAMICNPDMQFPQKNYLSELAKVLQNQENTVVAASDILHLDGYHQNPVFPDGDWRGALKGLVKMLLPIQYSKNSKQPDYIDNWQVSHICHKVSGCCFMIKLDFLKQIGFFDENVFLYCEESILSAQIKKNNKQMYYLADIQALHHHVKKEKHNAVRGFKFWYCSRKYFIRKYNEENFFAKLCHFAVLHICFIIFMILNTLKNIKRKILHA